LQTTFSRRLTASTANARSSASHAQADTGDRQQHPVVGVALGAALQVPAPAYHRLSHVQKHVQKPSMCLEETSYNVYLTISKTLDSFKVECVLQSDLFCCGKCKTCFAEASTISCLSTTQLAALRAHQCTCIRGVQQRPCPASQPVEF